MIKEAYCSFEVSKLLKEKGFDESCNSFYILLDNGDYRYTMSDFPYKNSCKYNVLSFARPTHQMAMKWLREMHNIHIAIDRGIEHYFAVLTKLKPYQDLTMKNDVFDTCEEAIEAALKYCLTELI